MSFYSKPYIDHKLNPHLPKTEEFESIKGLYPRDRLMYSEFLALPPELKQRVEKDYWLLEGVELLKKRGRNCPRVARFLKDKYYLLSQDHDGFFDRLIEIQKDPYPYNIIILGV